MKVLVACEYSGVVRDAFIRAGHDAMSCDLLDTEVPGPHYKGDVRDILGDGYDLMVGHPECTKLSSSGAKHLYWLERGGVSTIKLANGDTVPNYRRFAERDAAHAFVRELHDAPIPRIAIENPQGMLSGLWRRPDQYIEPWWYGHPESKKTGLWLKNLPPLVPNPDRDGWEESRASEVEAALQRGETPLLHPEAGAAETYAHMMTLPKSQRTRVHFMSPGPNRWKERSRTFTGIGAAMAQQWGTLSND